MSYIDESTHLQLVNACVALRGIIESIQARSGHPLSYDEMATVRQTSELVKAATTQLRLAGVLPPSPVGAKP